MHPVPGLVPPHPGDPELAPARRRMLQDWAICVASRRVPAALCGADALRAALMPEMPPR